MSNQFRSKAFIRIKHCIQSSIHAEHLTSCRQMMENATPILTKDEMTILKEYMLTAWDLINPIQIEWDRLESEYHQRKCGGQSTY